MTIMVIDGQGGKMGKGLVEMLKKSCPEDEILAIGTNSIATAAMLKAGLTRFEFGNLAGRNFNRFAGTGVAAGRSGAFADAESAKTDQTNFFAFL